MKPTISLAIHAGVGLLLTSQWSGAVPCVPAALDAPFVVEDTAGALQLAALTDCSGGTFDVSWVGSVTVQETIRVSDGSTLSVVGMSDGSSFVNGTGHGSLFEVIGGTLRLSGLSLINGNGGSAGGGGIHAVNSVLAIDCCTLSDNGGGFGGGLFLNNSKLNATASNFVRNVAPNDPSRAWYTPRAFFESSSSDTTSSGVSGSSFSDSRGLNIAPSGVSGRSSSDSSVPTIAPSGVSGSSSSDSSSPTIAPSGVSGSSSSDSISTSSYDSSTGGFTFDLSPNPLEGTGGAICAIDSVLASTNCTFSENDGYDAGGAISMFASVFALSDCTFSDNAGGKGGGLFLEQSVLTASGSTFTANLAVERGGAIYSNVGSSITVSGSNTWEDNSALNEGGALSVEDSILIILGNSVWAGNFAPAGGAVNVYNSTVDIPGNTVFAENSAKSSAGAIKAWRSALNISGSAVWARNSAVDSGGAVDATECAFAITGNAVFRDNILVGSSDGFGGGGLEISRDSTLEIAGHVEFVGNLAINGTWLGTNGGGLRADDSVNITISGSAIFEGNRAESGGEGGGEGGGVYLGSWSQMVVLAGGSVHFSRNVAESGGGIFCDTAAFIVEGHATFRGNRAASGAGAFLGDSSFLRLTGDNVTVVGNNASSRGGGIYAQATTQFVVENVTFSSNFAGTTGGAMSLLSVGTTSKAYALDDSADLLDCSFVGNEAGESGGAAFVAGGYVKFKRVGFGNNTAGVAGGAVLASGEVKLKYSMLEGNRAPLGPAIANTVSITLIQVVFTNNSLLCFDDGLFLEWKDVSAYEIACDACDVCGSRCLTMNPDKAQVCSPVMEHAASRAADGTIESLDIAPGYWRSSNTSTEIRECYEADACVGGSEEYCKDGYDGPFCAVCAEGFAIGWGYACSECDGARRGLTVVVGIALLVVASAVGVTGATYLRSPDEGTAVEACLKNLQTRLEGSRVSQWLKITIVSWQILSQFSSVASVTYPDVYEKFVENLHFLDLDVTWMLSPKCLVATNFYYTLLAVTIWPLVVCGLVLASYCRSSDDPALQEDIKRRHATFIYVVSVLIYSSSSSAVFQTFACDDLDNGKSFLRADHSIQCFTTAHKLSMAYAGIMAFLYPLGIPFCYLAILFPVRKKLMSDDEGTRENATVLRALPAPYCPRVYYYEVIECLRRVILSALVVFIPPDTGAQINVTFLVACGFFSWFMYLRPYETRYDACLDLLGHLIVLLSMYVALSVKVDIESDDSFSQEVYAGTLVVMNCAMVVLLSVEACLVCWKDDFSLGDVSITPVINLVRQAWESRQSAWGSIQGACGRAWNASVEMTNLNGRQRRASNSA